MLASTAIRGACRQIAIIVTLMAVGCSDMNHSPVEPPVAGIPPTCPS